MFLSLSVRSPSIRTSLWNNTFKLSCEFAIEIDSETEIGNQNTVSNYSSYFQKVFFYFSHRRTVQRPILITNSDREKCPPCALWVSCDLVRRRALVNTCPVLLINMTWGQKWPFSFGSTQSRVSICENTRFCMFLPIDLFLPHMFYKILAQIITYVLYNSVTWHICYVFARHILVKPSLAECIMHPFLFPPQSNCAQYAAEKRDEEKMCDHLIRAAKYRDHVTATQLIQKIVNILTDKHGAWGSSSIR